MAAQINLSSDELDAIRRTVRSGDFEVVQKVANILVRAHKDMAMCSNQPLTYEHYRESRGCILGIDEFILTLQNIANETEERKRGTK